jgi:hypothetical protein
MKGKTINRKISAIIVSSIGLACFVFFLFFSDSYPSLGKGCVYISVPLLVIALRLYAGSIKKQNHSTE